MFPWVWRDRQVLMAAVDWIDQLNHQHQNFLQLNSQRQNFLQLNFQQLNHQHQHFLQAAVAQLLLRRRRLRFLLFFDHRRMNAEQGLQISQASGLRTLSSWLTSAQMDCVRFAMIHKDTSFRLIVAILIMGSNAESTGHWKHLLMMTGAGQLKEDHWAS